MAKVKTEDKQVTANEFQVGGMHYADADIQAWDAITAWGLGFLDGNVVKYMSRWRKKGGIEDLRKALHYLTKVIEVVEIEQARRETTKATPLVDPSKTAERFAPTKAPGKPAPGKSRQVRMKDEVLPDDEAVTELTKALETTK